MAKPDLTVRTKAAPPGGLKVSTVPDLLNNESTPALETLYLDIPLGNATDGGTAVYLKNAAAATTPIDLLVYFHGHKGSLGRPGGKAVSLTDMALKDYMGPKVPEFDLRGFVAKAACSCALVVPALDNKSKAAALHGPGGPSANAGSNFDAFLQQVLNGIHAHHAGGTGGRPALRNVVLAAHSGGYACLRTVVQTAIAGVDSKIKEVWCLDCTYGTSGTDLVGWAKAAGHTLDRLWVYSSGDSAGTTADARNVLAVARRDKLANVEVSVPVPNKAGRQTRQTHNWGVSATGPGHNQCVGEFLPQLLTRTPHL